MNRAEARIDTAHLASNIALLKSTSKTALMAVVKADAYGHGLLRCWSFCRKSWC